MKEAPLAAYRDTLAQSRTWSEAQPRLRRDSVLARGSGSRSTEDHPRRDGRVRRPPGSDEWKAAAAATLAGNASSPKLGSHRPGVVASGSSDLSERDSFGVQLNRTSEHVLVHPLWSRGHARALTHVLDRPLRDTEVSGDVDRAIASLVATENLVALRGLELRGRPSRLVARRGTLDSFGSRSLTEVADSLHLCSRIQVAS